MTAKRVAAIVIAVVLIVAAVLIRNGLDDNSSSATDGTDKPSGGKITVICSTEFEAICKTLPSKYTVTIESAGETLDKLAKDGDSPPDAWITLDPFPSMVDVVRNGSGLTPLSQSVTVAATDAPLLALPPDRLKQFNVGCAGERAWLCIGKVTGQSWGQLQAGASGSVNVGITDPATEAGGLLTFGNAVAGFFGGTTFSSNAFTDDPAFVPWIRTMSKAKIASPDRSPLATLLTQVSSVNVAATTSSQATTSPQQDKFKTVDVQPAFNNVAVVATFGSNAGGLVDTVRSSLIAAGWAQATDATPQLPAGTFIALRKLWKDTK